LGYSRISAVVTIKIPRDQWGPVWRALVAAGPVSRVSEETLYLVTEDQLRLLKRKKLPFEVVDSANGRGVSEAHG
jgi:hypothetical protein